MYSKHVERCLFHILISVYFSFLFTLLSYCIVANIKSANTTISGRHCQRWDSQSPHIHPYSNLSAYENYCMNPNEDAAPWCYTTDAHHRTEFCWRPVSDGKLFHFLFYYSTYASQNYYRATHVLLARYCYRKSSVRPSVCLSIRP